MKYYFKIADSVLCIDCDSNIELSFFDDFCVEECKPDITVEFVPLETFSSLRDVRGTEIYGVESLETSLEGWPYSFRSVFRDNEVYLSCNDDWSYGVVGFEKGILPFQDMPSWAGVLLFGFYTKICEKNILLIHASAIEKDENGIVFIGPSNIGKTTQAELWHKYEGADILNGDKVFLKIKEENCIVYGNPWKGSSPYHLNKSVPLKGAVVLRQALKNEIHEISDEERLMKVLPHVFLPHWDENGLSYAVSALDQWLSSHKVYQLSCRKDAQAVYLVRDTLHIEE